MIVGAAFISVIMLEMLTNAVHMLVKPMSSRVSAMNARKYIETWDKVKKLRD